ncbi:MAG: urease subunit alpha, partial [Microlunatus sp.]|nr:urease subunit alpha [Microlunatus sp.]
KDGRVVAVGRAGNPDLQTGIELEVDAATAMITGEGLIATPGVVDSHVHLSNAELVPAALSSGVTTIVGMGIGGVWDVGANPRYNLHALIQGWSGFPVNAAFLGRGSSTSSDLLEETVLSGAGGFKVHEDWGATPTIIDTCLRLADQVDLPVALHTDSLNESGFLSDTLAAIDGRTVHAYHVEGGGGHPDLLRIVGEPHILTSSTTPTLPLTPSTVAELGPMTMTVHRGHHLLTSDSAIAASRIREHGIAAENRLHDAGGISIINSDGLGMGRIAETTRRTWQLAHVNATLTGQIGPDVVNNARALRYLAKLTINPAVAHGLEQEVGSLQPGRLADIVLWNPAWFGAAPELVIKSGFVVWGASGSGSGSTRLTQPRRMLPYWGGLGAAPSELARIFVAEDCLEDVASRRSLPAGHRYAAIKHSRGLSSSDMLLNTATPKVEVSQQPEPVRIDGAPVEIHRATRLPLTRTHQLA